MPSSCTTAVAAEGSAPLIGGDALAGGGVVSGESVVPDEVVGAGDVWATLVGPGATGRLGLRRSAATNATPTVITIASPSAPLIGFSQPTRRVRRRSRATRSRHVG